MEIPGSQRRVLNLMDEVIIEILSWLPVKYLLQLRCVCKSWKSLISHPCFVNLHLQRSPKNANLVLSIKHIRDPNNFGVMSCSKRSFMENPSSTIAAQEGGFRLNNNSYWVIGSCNGLVCLLGDSGSDEDLFQKYWFRFWNPATRLRSKKSPRLRVLHNNQFGSTNFGFGYDKSSDTYKVVAVLNNRNATDDSKRTQVKACTMGDHCWRDIQRFPSFPTIFGNEGSFLSGTLNWLAIRNFTGYNWDTIAIDQLVIVSLDLGKETYKQMLLPDGLDENENPDVRPTIGVLRDCLCLFHDYNQTNFVVWQMKEFGVQESWTPFVNVSYEHLQVKRPLWPWPQSFSVLPMCISENGDVLMLMDGECYKTILYYRRDNRVEHTDIPRNKFWIYAKDYVQSLVQPR